MFVRICERETKSSDLRGYIMEAEASIIAKKVRNYIVLANESVDHSTATEDGGVLKNIALILLMGAAICFTQATLFSVKLIKRIEA
mgnify:CR=1 FL=1